MYDHMMGFQGGNKKVFWDGEGRGGGIKEALYPDCQQAPGTPGAGDAGVNDYGGDGNDDDIDGIVNDEDTYITGTYQNSDWRWLDMINQPETWLEKAPNNYTGFQVQISKNMNTVDLLG